jgi:hypothetical protein
MGCPYGKLDPAILVMEATESRSRYDPTETLDRVMGWSVLAQRQMSASLVVVARHHTALSQPDNKGQQGHIRSRRQAGHQPIALGRQRARLASPQRLRRRTARRTQPL